MALDRNIEQAYARVDAWHNSLTNNGEVPGLSQRVVESRQAIPLTDPAVVNRDGAVVVAGFEFGVLETSVGVKDTGVLVRVTERVASPTAPGILTGEPVTRTKGGEVVRTTVFPLGTKAERTLGKLPAEVVSGIAANVRVPRPI